MKSALVNKILDVSCVDGPGNRTAIFFQGCNFRCEYCHNPETIEVCRHCGVCVPTCPTGALSLSGGRVLWDEERCCACDRCIHVCPHSASPRVKEMTVERVMAKIRANRPFIRGITVSGGECSLQRDFLLELFPQVRALGLTALMDSNGGLPIAEDEALMAVCDGVMLDIKCADPARHASLTGHTVDGVLENAAALAALHKLPEVRTVVIPDALPNEETVETVCRTLAPFLGETSIRYKLIQFRPMGVRGPAAEYQSPARAYMETLAQRVRAHGFTDVVIT